MMKSSTKDYMRIAEAYLNDILSHKKAARRAKKR